jgi:predicted ATP-dependent endonuclease of OLD family
MKINKIKISNFRSIVKLELKIDENNNFISFCGANNVGKTNILNALGLFFNKLEYIPEKDCPNHKYYGTRGGSYQPKIEIEFKSENADLYKITKNWSKIVSEKDVGEMPYELLGFKNKEKLTDRAIEDILKKINFFFLPSINLSFPEAIKYIMNSDIIDLETGRSRMSGRKGEMKLAIERVLSDLKSILDSLSDNISPLLEKYKTGWGVAFDLPAEINTFRDLMIGEVDFYIKDKSNSKAIDAKGSGLQRLCHILMYFRIIEKLNEKKQSAILCIDEPDVYLHSGLQKELLKDIKEKCKNNQIFITTHSPIFIDTLTLSNVFLLDQKIESKEYQRAKRKNSSLRFNAIETHLIDFNESSGISTLKNYLGINEKDNLLFDKYNLIVEGEEDKIYFSKLMKHFGLSIPCIIPCHGADNVTKYLDFYNSIADKQHGIRFVVVLDNDTKGRDVAKKIKSGNYQNIAVEKKFIISYSGFDPQVDRNGNCGANIEVEDFLDPKIVCYLANKILKQKGLTDLKKKDIDFICSNIIKPAYQNNGLLSILENKKNELNPNNGQDLKIDSNGDNKTGFKSGIANIFNQLDQGIISLIGDREDPKNASIFKFLSEVSEMKNE